jgi:hypothetical protein
MSAVDLADPAVAVHVGHQQPRRVAADVDEGDPHRAMG